MIPVLHGVWASPTDVLPPVSGYKLWLDASDGSTFTFSSGTSVSEWRDKSTNAYAFQQNTVANQPSRSGSQNGRTTVVFDGTNDILISTAAASTWKFLSDGSKATVFVMCKTPPSPSGFLGAFGTSEGSSEIGVYFGIGTNGTAPSFQSTNGVAGGGNIMYATGTSTANTYTIFTGIYDQNNATIGNRVRIYVNGGTATNNVIDKNPSTSNPSHTLAIGDLRSGSGLFYNGQIAEILMYPSLLNDTDREAVRDYLNTKWAVY